MENFIIDRRLAGKNKSIGNRERFIKRYKDAIKDAVRRDMAGRDDITGPSKPTEVWIPAKNITSPIFHHAAKGGRKEQVHPGNTDYYAGDRIPRPKGGGQDGGNGQGTGQGNGEHLDDFIFTLSEKDVTDILFEDWELPDFVKVTDDANTESKRSRRAGFSSSGTPNNLHHVKTMRAALARKMALGHSG